MGRQEDVGADNMTLLSDLTTEATDRDGNSGWTRECVTSIPEARDPDLLKPFKRAYLSDNSLAVLDTRTRKVIGPAVTNGELSRLYLKRVMANGAEAGSQILKKRVPWRREALQFADRCPAYYFTGQVGGPFELVDVTACYATLYSRLTLDLTYRPDTDPPLLGLGKAAFLSPGEWLTAKGPRNAAWGGVLSRHIREWRHGQPVDNLIPNRFFAPDLRGIVYDASHAMALEALEKFGAISWAVDGGVFRPGEGRAFAAWLESAWGLHAEVRAEGPGWLFGPVSYSIGPVTTKDVKAGRAIQWSEADTLRRQSEWKRQWLADAFKQREAA